MDTAYYCSQCKCPYHYCAKITFGDVVTRQVEYLLKEKNEPSKITYDWLELKFRGIYWNCVHHKIMINSIPFPDGYSFPSYGSLPSCIKLVYLNRLFRKYGKVCDENRDTFKQLFKMVGNLDNQEEKEFRVGKMVDISSNQIFERSRRRTFKYYRNKFDTNSQYCYKIKGICYT